MKTWLALPVLARAQDDTSTLLSLKVHTTLEAGVDHLLDAVGNRNVTQMNSLIQNLVEESISDGLGELDGDVKTALALIKAELLGDIRNSLREAHCYSQKSLHDNILCFEGCEKDKATGYKSCGDKCDGSAHKVCRDNLFGLYKEHITACRNLDHFVAEAISPCPSYDKTCCYLPHTTWNCGGICGSKIDHLEVDKALGKWIRKQINLFESVYEEWEGLYKACRASYRSYIEKDAECDCKQAECEARNCEWDSCHFLNCEVSYQKCWGGCEVEVCKNYPKEQCLEADRKIDWSATEKIECYIDVLMASPTKEQLLKHCGKEDCINIWRDEMYHTCNKRCPEVDTLAKGSPNAFPKWQDVKWEEVSEFVVAHEHGREGPAKGECYGKVKYGKGSTWTEWRDSAGTVDCKNGVFGDPLRGTVKECVCLGTSAAVPECAAEGDYHGVESLHERDGEHYYGVENQCIDVIMEAISKMGEHKRREGDEDLTGEGKTMRTRHRLEGDADARGDGYEIRCTDHLDIDWLAPPCCTPCQERDSPPCEGWTGAYGKEDESKYMWQFYGQHNFLSDKAISDFTRDTCYESAGEHTYEYAYNLCDCVECPKKDTPPCPTCTERKGCTGSYGGYNYKAHYTARDKSKCEDRDDGDRSGVGYAAAKKALAGKEGVLKDLSGEKPAAPEKPPAPETEEQ